MMTRIQPGSVPQSSSIYEVTSALRSMLADIVPPALYLILLPDERFTIITVSDAYLSTVHVQRDLILGKSLLEIPPYYSTEPEATSIKDMQHSLERVLKNAAPDTMLIHKYNIAKPVSEGGDIQICFWSSINTPVLNSQGKVDYIICRIEDVTELVLAKQKTAATDKEPIISIMRANQIQTEIDHFIEAFKRAQESIKLSDAQYQAISCILPTAVFRMDREGNCFYANPQWKKIMGIEIEQVKDKCWFNFVHPDDRLKALTLWQTWLQKKESDNVDNENTYKVECRFLLLNSPIGACIWVAGEIAFEKNEQGQCIGYVGTITDISNLKASHEKHLEVLQTIADKQRLRAEELEGCENEREQFIDTLCHELRNPLSGIYGNAALLEDNVIELEKLIESAALETPISELKQKLLEHIAQDKESIYAIYACSKHQKILTDDVLSLSKLKSGKLELNMIDFNPKKVIQDVVAMLSLSAKQKKIRLNLKFYQSDIMAKGDPDRLAQVLLNLVGNAIKFTSEEGEISISVSEETGPDNFVLLTFSIKDSGIGMSQDEKEKIFNRFTQARRTIYAEYGGSGLGLVICKSLVELMGGEIKVNTEKGVGTEFIFTVKCKKALIPSEKSISSFSLFQKPVLALSKTPQRILIAEDNIINQKMLSQILQKDGHVCDIACNGEEACAMAEKTAYDIILMDIDMPIMNGLDATKIIRKRELAENRAHVPIIGLSGNARKEFLKEANDAGMNDYMTKPFERTILLKMISSLILPKAEKSPEPGKS